VKYRAFKFAVKIATFAMFPVVVFVLGYRTAYKYTSAWLMQQMDAASKKGQHDSHSSN
jgi:hypothetical protein